MLFIMHILAIEECCGDAWTLDAGKTRGYCATLNLQQHVCGYIYSCHSSGKLPVFVSFSSTDIVHFLSLTRAIQVFANRLTLCLEHENAVVLGSFVEPRYASSQCLARNSWVRVTTIYFGI